MTSQTVNEDIEITNRPRELSAEEYKTILRNVHDAVYTLDPNGRITWVNEIVFKDYDIGYSREELIGAYVSKIMSMEDIEKCAEIISELLQNEDRDSSRVEITIQTASGREIPCDLHLALMPDGDGGYQGTVGVLRDITDRKRREQGQMVMNRVLRHHMRNKLNVIRGMAELLGDDSVDASSSQSRSIIEATEELLRLSNKARQVDEALTAGDWSLEPIDVVELVQQRCEALEARFPEADISIETSGDVWARANQRLTIVIDNLLENAIEHSEQRSPDIDVSLASTPGDFGVEIRIADDGPGIHQMEIEPLKQEMETPLRHGSGLGLWVVKWLTERFYGQLKIENRSPRGSVVVVRLQGADAD